MAKTIRRIPQTKPSWTAGKYSVYVNDELQGYFRQFRSAWLWREYLRTQHPNERLFIQEKGSIINISNPQTAGTL